jgi:hypothetical protein
MWSSDNEREPNEARNEPLCHVRGRMRRPGQWLCECAALSLQCSAARGKQRASTPVWSNFNDTVGRRQLNCRILRSASASSCKRLAIHSSTAMKPAERNRLLTADQRKPRVDRVIRSYVQRMSPAAPPNRQAMLPA